MKVYELFEKNITGRRTEKEMTSPEILAMKYSMYSDETLKALAAKNDFRAKRELKTREQEAQS